MLCRLLQDVISVLKSRSRGVLLKGLGLVSRNLGRSQSLLSQDQKILINDHNCEMGGPHGLAVVAVYLLV